MRGHYFRLKTIIDYLRTKGEHNAADILEDSEYFLPGINVTECTNEYVVYYDLLLNREDEVKDYVQNQMAHQFADFIKDNLEWIERDDPAMQAKIFKVYLSLVEPKEQTICFKPAEGRPESVLKEITNG